MENFFYRVQSGDSVISLSNRFFVPTRDLIEENALKEEIREGDVLYISPKDNAYPVSPHETAEDLSKKFGKSADEILKENGVSYLFYGLILRI